jgi:hypothetical protein
LFYTDKPVRVHRPDMIMYGVGLSAPQDFKTFEMYKITNSVLRVSDVSSQDTVRSVQDSSQLSLQDSVRRSQDPLRRR